MIGVRIAGTASARPGRSVSTAELAARAFPGRDPEELVQRTGIRSRYWSDPDVPLDAYAAEAVSAALEDAGVAAGDIRRLIVANCTGAELHFPGSANRVAARLGLTGADVFDVNNACMGFLTAFDLAARSVATGVGPVAVVAIELCSRHLTPEDPRPYLVFADGVGAAVLTEGAGGSGVVASHLRNDGALGGNTILRNGNLTEKVEYIEFPSTNRVMTDIALEKVERAAQDVLMQSGLRLEEVDWVLPHQPNGSMLDKMIDRLGLEPERLVRLVHEIGSVGSAAIPMSLDALRRERGVGPGQHVLMVGVGAGVSSGAILYREAA